MPESLSISLTDLRREVSRFLGWNRTYSSLSTQEQSDLADILKCGLRYFYWPTGADGTRHSWSFLRPVATLSLTAADRDYDLPADFSAPLPGGFTYETDSKRVRMAQVGEEEIRALWATAEKSAPPVYFAIRPKVIAVGGETLHEVIFYPVPDASYTASYAYAIIPPPLETGVNEYPLGGATHSETILEACLYAAEKTLNDGQEIHAKRFMACLAGSIAIDKQQDSLASSAATWEIVEPVYGTYSYLAREVAAVLGYGHNAKAWTYFEERRVNSLVQNGIRQFYFPPIVGEKAHSWSFLRPVASLALVVGQYAYDLPSDFGMGLSEVTYSSDQKQVKIEVTSDENLRAMRSKAFLNGPPKYAAVRPKAVNHGAEQQWEIVFYPLPDAAYPLEYRYNVSPSDAGLEAQYPLGTRTHAETVLASCLSCAELARDGKRGAFHERFVERLAASVQLDLTVAI